LLPSLLFFLPQGLAAGLVKVKVEVVSLRLFMVSNCPPCHIIFVSVFIFPSSVRCSRLTPEENAYFFIPDCRCLFLLHEIPRSRMAHITATAYLGSTFDRVCGFLFPRFLFVVLWFAFISCFHPRHTGISVQRYYSRLGIFFFFLFFFVVLFHPFCCCFICVIFPFRSILSSFPATFATMRSLSSR